MGDRTVDLPCFNPDAELCVNTATGAVMWTGKQWNDHMASAERTQQQVTVRLISIEDLGRSATPVGALDLDAIRQRERAADRGPWTAHPDGLVWSQLIGDPVSGSVLIENAEFIAHARTDVPALLAKVDELTAEVAQLTAYNRSVKGANADLRELLAAANRRADGLANDLRSAQRGLTEYANQTGGDGRKQAAADIEDMPINLGDAGWEYLEQKAIEASYPAEWVRRRRTRDDFTTATIEVAYQYGYRQAAKVARGEVASPPPTLWELRAAATGGGPCGTCDQPIYTHVCLSCSLDAQTPGPGCHNCRNTGMDQTPCRPPG